MVVISVKLTSLLNTPLPVILNIGDEATLKATATPKGASQEFVWKSSAENSVYVVGGKLTAYATPEKVYTDAEKAKYYDEAKGKYYVEITASNYTKKKEELKTATCKVFVTNESHDESLEANSISLSENRIDLEIGDTFDVYATVAPIGLLDEDKKVDWSCSDTSVASLSGETQPSSTAEEFKAKHSSKVTVTALKAGTATLYAQDHKTGELKTSCAINVIPEPEVVHVTSISFSEDNLNIEQGKTGQNNLTILPWTAENKEITYTSSDETIATVDENGVVKVKDDATIGATVTITATSVDGNFTDTFTVKVSEHHSNYIFLSKAGETSWEAFEMPLNENDDSEYHIASLELDIGDEFVFCTGVDSGNETWHHYAQLKDDTGSAKGNFSDNGGNILCSRGGEYEVYVQSDSSECVWPEVDGVPVMKSIWITAKSLDPLPDLTMTVIHEGSA